MITIYVLGIIVCLVILYYNNKHYTIKHYSDTWVSKHWWGNTTYYVRMVKYPHKQLEVTKIAAVSQRDDTPDEVTLYLPLPDFGWPNLVEPLLEPEWSDFLKGIEICTFQDIVDFTDGVYTDLSQFKTKMKVQCELKDVDFFKKAGYKVTRQIDDHMCEMEKELTSKVLS